MHGIVSLLDEDHYKMVEDVWAGLEEALGVRGVYTTPFPHFSYHVAEHYDADLLEPLLRDFAAKTAPFEILTTGLGIFTEGLNPIIYVNVARSPLLSQINAALWSQMNNVSAGIVEYYHPEHWVPHITLGFGDITQENLAEAIHLLSRWNFTWQIPIDNIALLFNPIDTKQDHLHYRFALTGA
jgi:2'-5' RNA ligase